MLEEELKDFAIQANLHVIDVERHEFIAEAYDIMMVPTLVSGNCTISGVPTESDLRSFVMQSFPGVCHLGSEPSPYRILSGMKELMRADKIKELREPVTTRAIDQS